jgi:hypothetical protein
MTELSRRSLITGLVSLVAAPAIVRATSLMPVKTIDPELVYFEWAGNSIRAEAHIVELLKRRIANAERVMIENINTCIFGGRVYGISGSSNYIYYSDPLGSVS